MWRAIIEAVRKIGCHHCWRILKTTEHEFFARHILDCRLCGKIRRIDT
jgi:hypothetical protein